MFDTSILMHSWELSNAIKGLTLDQYRAKKKMISRWFDARRIPVDFVENRVKTEVLIVDPQKDFAQEGGALYVKGASEDMRRALGFLCSIFDIISKLHISMDDHFPGAIYFPERHIMPTGNHPEPFTQVTADNYLYGHWTSNDEFGGDKDELTRLTIHYCLEAAKKGIALQLWNHHCMNGTRGAQLVDPITIFLDLFETFRSIPSHVFTKGQSKNTEYYSVFGPVVEKDFDNRSLAGKPGLTVQDFAEADIIIVMGEALSHCVGETLHDMIDARLGKKIYLVSDCTSNVEGFEAQGERFLKLLQAHDGHVVKSTTPFLDWPGVRELYDKAYR